MKAHHRPVSTCGIVVVFLILVSAGIARTGWAQTPPSTGESQESKPAAEPTASHGGKVQVRPPRPVTDTEDRVNQLASNETVDGVVLSITINDTAVTLDHVAPARVPRRSTGVRRDLEGDRVTVTGLIGGKVVATTIVPDNVLNASEGGGLVRTPRRQLAVALATDRPLETVRVEAPATGATATLDARAAYARICEADPRNKWCPQEQQQPPRQD
jgi:hypothetical protein